MGSSEHLFRREFIIEGGKLILALPAVTGALAALTSFFSGEIGTVAQEAPHEYSIPTYKGTIEPALKRYGIEIIPGNELAGNGSFKEFLIRRAGRIIGKFFTQEKNKNGYFDLIVTNGDRPETFQARAQQYEQSHPGTKMVLQVAGAFSCDDEKCISPNPRNWEPDGVLIQNGKSVGWPNLNPIYGGVVVLRKGADPAIYSRNNIPLDGSRSTILKKVAITVPRELINASILQAYTLVEEGQPQRFHDRRKMARRILCERHYLDAGNNLQYGWAIFQLDDRKMTLTDIGEFLRDFGVRNAALLNTGSHGLGWVKRHKEKEEFLLTQHTGEHTMPNFTNIIAAVSQEKRLE